MEEAKILDAQPALEVYPRNEPAPPPAHRPKPDIRELTLCNGIAYPSDEELLMLILSRGTRDMPVEKMSQKVLEVLNSSNPEDLVHRLGKISGVGTAKALAVAAAMELGRRRYSHLKAVINRPSDIVPYIKHYAIEATEHFVCASLNGAHEIIGIRVVSVGTATRALVHPREIYAAPVAEHASGIICCHNHPCGSCIPSLADRETTQMLQNAAQVLGISFLDHIIVTRDAYFSFLEHGLLCPDGGL